MLCQTHLSISHNSFFTQPRIDLLSQMRGHNKLFAVVPDTADNGNYSQTARAARGREPTCYQIHIQRWFKGGRSALRGGESAARNAGDGAGVAFLHHLPNQSATPQSSQWASTMCTCQIIASNALGADASDRQRRPSAQQTALPALRCTDSLLSGHLPVIIQIKDASPI